MLPIAIVTVVCLCLVILGVIICIRMWKARFLRGADRAEIRRAWKQVLAAHNATLQVMEADKVLDMALKRLGYTGTLGDKLKSAGARFSRLNDVWHAHRIRNRIAHEMGATVSDSERKIVLRTFEHALRELGM